MRSPASLAAKGLLGVILSLVALLLLALPALAQAPGPTPGPGDALARFFMFLSLILVGIIILSALLVAFLMWANGQPVPGLSPVLQELTAREVDAEGRPTGPSNIVKIAVGVGGLVVVVLLVAFVVPAIMSGTQPAAPTMTPTAVAQATTAPAATAAPVVQAPPGVAQTIQASGCGGCHTIPGVQGAAGTVGPSLANIGTAAQEIITSPGYTGQAKTVKDYIHESIVSPNTYVVPNYPANVMPQNFQQAIPPDQLDALVAYLSSLK